MARRLTLFLIVAMALAAFASGCGGDEPSGSLGDSLAYLPKEAPFVATISSDVEGEQYQNLDRMLSKFPFGGQVKNQIKQQINQQGADYEKDVKPLLGGELVIGALDAASLRNTSQGRFVFAYAASSGDKLAETIAKDRDYREAGDFEGGKLYEATNGGSVVVVKDETMVGARNREDLQAAFDRHDGDEHLTEDEFTSAFEDLPEEPLMRIYGDAQALITSSPQTAAARNVKWIAGLRTFGVTVSAERDGLALDGRVNTEGVSPQDLPIAAGDESPAVARFGDYSSGQRDLAQTLRFAQATAQKTDPEGFARFEQRKQELGQKLDIDVDRDFIDQFSGDTTVAGGLDGSWSLHSEVKDPEAMRETLEKMAGAGRVGDLQLSESGDLIKAVDEDGETVYLGMVDDVFVAGPDPEGAKRLATVEPRPLPEAKGAQVFVADGEAIAKTIIERSGQGGAAGLFTGPIGDLTGYVSASPDGMRARAKLKIE